MLSKMCDHLSGAQPVEYAVQSGPVARCHHALLFRTRHKRCSHCQSSHALPGPQQQRLPLFPLQRRVLLSNPQQRRTPPGACQCLNVAVSNTQCQLQPRALSMAGTDRIANHTRIWIRQTAGVQDLVTHTSPSHVLRRYIAPSILAGAMQPRP